MNLDKNLESRNNPIIESNIKKLQDELLDIINKSSSADVTEVNGKQYQYVVIGGSIDIETGEIVALDDEENKLPEYQSADFSVKVLTGRVLKTLEERLSQSPFPFEITDVVINENINPEVKNVLYKSFEGFVISRV